MSRKHRGRARGDPVTYQTPLPAGGVQLKTFLPWTPVRRGLKKQVITPLDVPREFLDEARRERLMRAAAQDTPQQDLVQLLDVVLGERDVLPRRKHQVHQLGITGHFLLVAGSEGLDLQVRQQLLHLPVGQLAALDAGRGANTLDGG